MGDERVQPNQPGADDLNAVGGHCPVCGQEYRPGFTVCADDGTPLAAGPAPPPMPEDDDTPARGAEGPDSGSAMPDVSADLDEEDDLGPTPVVLGQWPVQEAMLVAGRLRASGIRAVAELDGNYGPYSSIPAVGGLVRVLVAEADAQRAGAIIARIQGT